MSENHYLNAICEYLQLRGYFFWRSNNIAIYDPKIKRYRALPKFAKKGVPDVILIKEGQFWGLEVKQPKKYLSPDQKQFLLDCESAGGKYFMVRTIEDLQDLGL